MVADVVKLDREPNSFPRIISGAMLALLIGLHAGPEFFTGDLEAEEPAISRLAEDLNGHQSERMKSSDVVQAESSVTAVSAHAPTVYIRPGVVTELLKKGDKVNYLFKSKSEAFGAGNRTEHILIAEGTICNLEGDQAAVYWRSIRNIRSTMAWARTDNSDQWGAEVLGDCDTSATKLPELKNVVPQSELRQLERFSH